MLTTLIIFKTKKVRIERVWGNNGKERFAVIGGRSLGGPLRGSKTNYCI